MYLKELSKNRPTLSESITNMFYFSASLCLCCGLEESKSILKNMMERLKKDQLVLSELSPSVRKTFEFYCQNQNLFA